MAHTPKARRKKLHKLEEQIEEDGKIQKEKLLAQMSYQWGTTERTSKDYINTLKNLDKIKEEDGVIKYQETEKEEVEA